MDDERPWHYTFCDMRTGAELASLPLTGVKYGRALRGVGKIDAYLSVADQRVRDLNPWAATRGRRVALYVEYRGRCVWGGPVLARTRSAGSGGLDLTGVTWEGWLHRQRLLRNVVAADATRLDAARALVDAAQSVTGVGFTVVQDGPAPGTVSNYRWLAREVKPVLELIEGLDREDVEDVPLEFRVDCVPDAEGLYRPQLVLGEPRLGRRLEDAAVEFSWPGGGLLDWSLPEDGSGASNYMPLLGAGSGALQPFSVLRDVDAGVDEIAAGFPTWMQDYRASDTSNMTHIRARGAAAMRDGLAAETVLTGVKVRAADYLGAVQPGDDLRLNITDPVLEEWPAEVSYLTRVLGESVTVGDGGEADSVSLTVGAAA